MHYQDLLEHPRCGARSTRPQLIWEPGPPTHEDDGIVACVAQPQGGRSCWHQRAWRNCGWQSACMLVKDRAVTPNLGNSSKHLDARKQGQQQRGCNCGNDNFRIHAILLRRRFLSGVSERMSKLLNKQPLKQSKKTRVLPEQEVEQAHKDCFTEKPHVITTAIERILNPRRGPPLRRQSEVPPMLGQVTASTLKLRIRGSHRRHVVFLKVLHTHTSSSMRGCSLASCRLHNYDHGTGRLVPKGGSTARNSV